MCRIAFDSMIAERCGASKRLPFLGINQKNNSWMNKKERAFEMYILFDPLIRSNSCIFICDDGHKITSSRVDRLYSPSLSLDFTFQSIFCSFSSLLIYLFGWCVCVFFSALSFTEICTHKTENRLECVHMKQRMKKNTLIFFTWAKKCFVHTSICVILCAFLPV